MLLSCGQQGIMWVLCSACKWMWENETWRHCEKQHWAAVSDTVATLLRHFGCLTWAHEGMSWLKLYQQLFPHVKGHNIKRFLLQWQGQYWNSTNTALQLHLFYPHIWNSVLPSSAATSQIQAKKVTSKLGGQQLVRTSLRDPTQTFGSLHLLHYFSPLPLPFKWIQLVQWLTSEHISSTCPRL